MGDGNNRQFFTDVAHVSLDYTGEGEIDVEDDDFDPSEAETVTLDTPWADFFGTDTFVQFDATVAQPIVQPYIHDGEIRKFKKDAEELRKAQAQIDNLPWTAGHPPRKRVRTSEQIRGFWSDPRWNDGQQATLHVPVNDPDAVRYAVTNDNVSIGFSGELDWTDDDTDAGYDAIQRNMAYDHIASVERGRCPPDEGCGLHTDTVDLHGHSFADAIQTQTNEESEIPDVPDSDKWNIGDWVSFTVDGERHHGRIAYVDEERALVKRYDSDDHELTDESTTVATSSLQTWSGPYADSCEGVCTCGCHEDDSDTTNNDNNTTDMTDNPGEFYDGTPDIEQLADDFDAVADLVDEKEELAEEKEDLEDDVAILADEKEKLEDKAELLEDELEQVTDEVEQFRREQYEQKAEQLADLVDSKWDTEELMEKFDAEDGWTVDDVEERIEIVEEVRSSETTTVNDGGDGGTEEDEEPDIERTASGKFDLRDRTKVQ